MKGPESNRAMDPVVEDIDDVENEGKKGVLSRYLSSEKKNNDEESPLSSRIKVGEDRIFT